MEKLCNPQNTIALIRKYDFDFQKKFGQNFLIDPHVIEKMIRAAGITPDDFVLEIGPGIGTLTQYLAEAARSVAAVEIDRNLIPILAETLSGYSNVTVIPGDIMKMDLRELVEEYNQGKPMKVVANLPYYITTPVLMRLLESHVPLESITVMVQKEVAQRMQAGPGGKDYGALSLAVQYYAEPFYAGDVPLNCFIPRPGVTSAVISLRCHEKPPVAVKEEALLFALIRASFNQRRKTLANGIANAADLPYGREEIVRALTAIGLPANIRGEQLRLDQFAALANELHG